MKWKDRKGQEDDGPGMMDRTLGRGVGVEQGGCG